eukprot:TRINITY_DN5059_c0_g1_i10.p2 TRINITY_DN5059_c0_g1~~TRINITY_DN5059_c0_g1_i10.p2  ORF type:complete len:136 (-),score=24.21 TRINITY_DN5059_c0_g1_i10:124-531(-)
MQIVLRSVDQWHGFDVPFNLGTDGDGAKSAGEYKGIEVMKNDILVLATDGLWNNVSDDGLISCIYPFVDNNDEVLDIDLVSEIIGEYSKTVDASVSLDKPFVKKARRQRIGNVMVPPNDVTLIVAQIRAREKASA